MKSTLRGELTHNSHQDRFSLTNSDMVMAIAEYLNVTEDEDMKKISDSISPVLLNSVASTVSDTLLTF